MIDAVALCLKYDHLFKIFVFGRLPNTVDNKYPVQQSWYSTITKCATEIDFPHHELGIAQACVTYQTTRPLIRRHDFTRNQSTNPLNNRGHCCQ